MKRTILMVALLVGACGDDAAWSVFDYSWEQTVVAGDMPCGPLGEPLWDGPPPTPDWATQPTEEWRVISSTPGEEFTVERTLLPGGDTYTVSWTRYVPPSGFEPEEMRSIRLDGRITGDSCDAGMQWQGTLIE